MTSDRDNWGATGGEGRPYSGKDVERWVPGPLPPTEDTWVAGETKAKEGRPLVLVKENQRIILREGKGFRQE